MRTKCAENPKIKISITLSYRTNVLAVRYGIPRSAICESALEAEICRLEAEHARKMLSVAEKEIIGAPVKTAPIVTPHGGTG